MRIYSVEYADNGYNDDYFNGSFADCVRVVDTLVNSGVDKDDIQIAEVEIENDCVTFTYNVTKATDL